MEYDNPAARLLAIIEEGKKMPQQASCRDVWHKLLRTENKLPTLMARLGKLMELPMHITQAVEDHYPAHLKHLRYWEGQVNTAFMHQNLHGQWGSFIDHIDSHTMAYLAMTSELLQQKSNTKAVEDDELLSVRENLDELYKEVLTSDIPEEIRLYLVRYLREILGSIDEYFITGALPILAASGTLLGHAFVHEEYRSFLMNEKLGGRIFECLTAMSNVITVAIGLPQLSAAIGTGLLAAS